MKINFAYALGIVMFLLMLPVVFIGAIYHIVERYFVCGRELTQLFIDQLVEFLEKE